MNIKIKKNFLTLFGIGYIKIASGTFASLFTCFFYYFLILLNINLGVPAFILLFIIPASIITINSNQRLFSEIDAREIVIDEFIGQSISIISAYYFFLIFHDFNMNEDKWFLTKFMFIAFISFRVFDILKPFPINLIDKIKNGYGVVMDDILAGIYSTIFLYIVYKITD